MRISDWSSDVCSSDLAAEQLHDLVDDDGDGQADQGDRQELVAAGEGQQFFEIHGGRARAGRRPGIVAQPAGPDACRGRGSGFSREPWLLPLRRRGEVGRGWSRLALIPKAPLPNPSGPRSEEHTSELQSLMRISYAVFCLKKKT